MLDEIFEAKGEDEVVLRVHVQPGSGRSAMVGKHGNALKVRVAAPPVDGRANEALLTLLAHDLGVAADQLTLLSGDSSRAKRVKVTGIDPAEVSRRIEDAVAAGAAGNAPAGRNARRAGR